MITQIGDIVLIHRQGEPVVYARVEQITADSKPHWWHIELKLLLVPAQPATWILKEEYIDGEEFSMGGEKMCLERLPEPAGMAAPKPPQEPSGGGNGEKVVSLASRRRER